MMTNLPRSVLDSKHPDVTGCGSDFEGYFKIDGLYWQSSFKTGARTRTACMQDCNEAKNCIGFTARKKNGAERLRCTLHKGLQQQMDHRAVSYSKCQFKGFACLNGFQFSHAGTWRNGIKQKRLDDEDMVECQKMCKMNKACVAFTHRVNKMDDKFCLHFEDAGNEEGAKKESKANTYTKCVLEGSIQLAIEDEVNSTAEDNSTLEDPASADEPSQVVGGSPAQANEQSQDDDDSL